MNGLQSTMIMIAIRPAFMTVVIMTVVIVVGMTMVVMPVMIMVIMTAIRTTFMIMTMVAVIMVMIVIIRLQKSRLKFENAVKIESIATQHDIERHVALHRPMNGRIRIDAANTRFHFLNLSRRYEIGLVDDDDIGKSDLVLGFRRILQALSLIHI